MGGGREEESEEGERGEGGREGGVREGGGGKANDERCFQSHTQRSLPVILTRCASGHLVVRPGRQQLTGSVLGCTT